MTNNLNRPNTSEKQAAEPSCRIVTAAESILRANQYHAIREVSCRFQEGVLTLLGNVPSFYLKQVAQTAVRGIEGVVQVENRLTVGPPLQQDEGQSSVA